MKITLRTGEPVRGREPLVVLAMTKEDAGRTRLSGPFAAVDRACGGALRALLASGDFKGKKGSTATLYPGQGPRRVEVMGLGPAASLDGEALRQAGGRATRRASGLEVERLTLVCTRPGELEEAAASQALAEGLQLGGYRFRLAQKAAPGKEVKSATVVAPGWRSNRAAREGLQRGSLFGESQNLARRLSDEPPNHMTPADLAREARAMCKRTGLGCRVMTETELKRRKMGGILAVGGGSVHPPRLVVMEHAPKRRGKGPTLCVVGKGVTFDSGGISIKPSANMHEMKHDMSGAANTIGIMHAVALLDLPVHVVGLIGCAENLPSATAYRPGDIVTTFSGKTVEILNTDAEGRVVLADVLHYARKEYDPDVMVDLATLTGACQVALGGWASGVFTKDSALAEELLAAGERSGDPGWRLPLFPAHEQAVKSQVADLRNAGLRFGGASTAAAFLQAFAGKGAWAHLDIAGTGWTDRATPTQQIGATGAGVRLVTEFLSTRAAAAPRPSRPRKAAGKKKK